MKRLTLLYVLLYAGTAVRAQSDGRLSGIRYLQGTATSGDPVKWLPQQLQANAQFRLVSADSVTDLAGNRHIRYRQYYQGLPVEGAMLNLHYRAGRPYCFSADCFPALETNIEAGIDEATALTYALTVFKDQPVFSWQDPQPLSLPGRTDNPHLGSIPRGERVIAVNRKTSSSPAFRLAYSFRIYTVAPLAYKRILVDAADGAVLGIHDLIYHNDRAGIAHTKYSGILPIVCDSMDTGRYKLLERGRGADSIYVLSIKEPGYWLYDDDNVWNNVNAHKDEAATDVHFGLEQAYDYLQTRFGRNSYDNKGHELSAIIHAGTKSNEAYWNSAYGRMVLGDGDDISYDAWTSIDIVAHELTHGLTERTADLEYEKEPGALNESFSDIFGKCVEHFALPDSFSWNLADKIMIGGALSIRSFSDPNSRKHPWYYKGRYYDDTTSADNYGVHTNSSVQNHWFYLLSEGGSGLREDGRPFAVSKIGIDTAAMIAYYTLTAYLTPYSGFKDAATASAAVAGSLFPGLPSIEHAVTEAWYAVGVLDRTETIIDTYNNNSWLSIYPNPAQDQVWLRSADPLQQTRFRFFDITGRALSVDYTLLTDREVCFSTELLPPGLYFLEAIKNGGSRQLFKVLKN